MVITKRHILRIFFLLEIMVFVGIYLFSSKGLQVVRKMERDNQKVLNRIALLQKEIDTLQEEVADWDNNSFYKEKIAREQLQMAKEGEQVYFL